MGNHLWASHLSDSPMPQPGRHALALREFVEALAGIDAGPRIRIVGGAAIGLTQTRESPKEKLVAASTWCASSAP